SVQGSPRAAADAGPVHGCAPELAVADPAEERLHQRMSRGERIVLLVRDGDGAAERAKDDTVARQVESGERIDLQLGTDVRRDLPRQYVDLDVDGETDPLRRLDGHDFQAPFEVV